MCKPYTFFDWVEYSPKVWEVSVSRADFDAVVNGAGEMFIRPDNRALILDVESVSIAPGPEHYFDHLPASVLKGFEGPPMVDEDDEGAPDYLLISVRGGE